RSSGGCGRAGRREASASSERLQHENLEHRRAQRPVARRQDALAEVGAKNRIPWRTQVHGNSDARDRIPQAMGRIVAAPRAVEEEVEPVLIEDVERIRASHHRELAVADARCRDAVNARIVEQTELILREPVQIAAAEPRPVHVDLLERIEIEIARQARLVLLVAARRRRLRDALTRLPEAPRFPGGAAEPGAVQQQAVAAAAIFPGAAEAL